ncbi:MAG: hypothetical protein SFT90_02480 [Rickettsiales bacterium]|nr:hypothetical protein [Rickettsiales bacterium]
MTKEDKFEFDELTASRINQMTSILEVISPIEIMKQNPTLTKAGIDFYKALIQAPSDVADYFLTKLTNGKTDDNDALKTGVASNVKELKELYDDWVSKLQAQFPNLSITQIKEHIYSAGYAVNVNQEQLKQESAKKAEEDAKAAAEAAKMIGGLMLASTGLILAGNALSNCEECHNFAADMLKNPLIPGLFNKSKENVIS